MFTDLVGKKFYIQEGLEGVPSNIDFGGLICYDKKWTVYTMAPL